MSLDNQTEQLNTPSSQTANTSQNVTIPSTHEIAQRAEIQRREDSLSPIESRQLNGILAYEEKRRNHLFCAIYILATIAACLYIAMGCWVYNHGAEKDSWHILLILAIPATSFTFLIIRILSKPESHNSKDDEGVVPLISLVKELKGLIDIKP